MNSMINNIVFDMGGVLIRWDPIGFANELCLGPEDTGLLLKYTYQSPLWAEMDWGRADEVDVYTAACKNLPERLHPYAERLIYHWSKHVQPIAGMEQLVRDCKLAGKKVYLLSNASHRQKDYWPDVPAHEIFDGRIVSAEVGVVKPRRRIFKILLETYGLKANECVFIDDMWQNVLGAMNAGLHGVVFDGDTDRLRRILSMML